MKRILSSFAMAFALVALSCQAIVPSDVPSFVCSGSSLDACPAGNFCKGAGCAPCETSDICDGYDNDCNGKIDDGRLSDNDSDGYTSCGKNVDGRIVEVDCDDNDPSVHPGAGTSEVCDGKDNNCDGKVDDVCPAGQVCSPSVGGCVDIKCDPANPSTCDTKEICDEATQQCLTPGSKVLGDPCQSPVECESSTYCGDGSRASISSRVCVKNCCKSEDCPVGFVCWDQSNTGARLCTKGSLVGASITGVKSGGQTCSIGGDCRSGRCSAGRCIDVCCSDSNCNAGTLCRTAKISEGMTSACVYPPTVSAAKLEVCAKDGEPSATKTCRSGTCGLSGTEGTWACFEGCCSSAKCGFQGNLPVVCANVPVLGAIDAYIPSCAYTLPTTARLVTGAPCTDSVQCRGGKCIATHDGKAKYCSDICCTDNDCPSPLKCRPSLSETPIFRCQKD